MEASRGFPATAACMENPKFDAAECGASGDTALFLNVENRHQRTTIFLIENGVYACKLRIFAAAGNGSKEAVKLLILKWGFYTQSTYRQELIQDQVSNLIHSQESCLVGRSGKFVLFRKVSGTLLIQDEFISPYNGWSWFSVPEKVNEIMK